MDNSQTRQRFSQKTRLKSFLRVLIRTRPLQIKKHFGQKSHCNDNCNDFSDNYDIIAPLDKLIMSFIYNSLSPYPQGCKNVTSVQCLIWQLRFFDLLKSMIYELKRSVGLKDGCLDPLLHSSLDHLVEKAVGPPHFELLGCNCF